MTKVGVVAKFSILSKTAIAMMSNSIEENRRDSLWCGWDISHV